MTSSVVVFDTSVPIDQLRTNRHAERFRELHGIVRNSAVVLSGLAGGADEESEKRFVPELADNYAALAPTTSDWLEAGTMLSKIRKDKGFLADKLRDLHFDALIALTARRYGATVITTNRSDFELLKLYKGFKLEAW